LYTTDALFELLSSLSLINNKEHRRTKKFRDNARDYWLEYFNIEKFETNEKKFAASFSTDGINVSVHLTRKVRKKPNLNDQLSHLNFKMKNGSFSSYVGIDPGARCMFGLVKDEENTLYKSSTFRYRTKEFQRRKLQKKLTDNVLSEVSKDREKIEKQNNTVISRKYNYIEFTRFQLKHFQKLQNTFT